MQSGSKYIFTIFCIAFVSILKVFLKRTKEQVTIGYNLIHTLNPLVNVVSCLTAPIIAGQELRILTLLAIALPNPLIDSATEGPVVKNTPYMEPTLQRLSPGSPYKGLLTSVA